MKSFLRLAEIVNSSVEVINAQKAEQEKTKLGLCRAGSSGAITKEGAHYYAQCGRIAQARLLGFERAPSASLLTMFEGGLSLENYVEKALIAKGAVFKKEQPVKGKIGKVEVSGRPDFDVQIDGEMCGIEIKSMASPFSTIKQVKNGAPLIKHLVQSCVYMMLLKRDKWLVAVGNIFFANERGFKVDPGIRYYEVRPSKKGFEVENEKGDVYALPFCKADIVRYYEQLKLLTEQKKLMARPTVFELNMKSYNPCTYCPLSGSCNSFEAGQIDFDQWLGTIPTIKE